VSATDTIACLAGIMVVYATPNLPVAGVLSSLFFGIWNLFTGFLIGHQVSLQVGVGLATDLHFGYSALLLSLFPFPPIDLNGPSKWGL